MADLPTSPIGVSGGDQSPRPSVREQDRYLPIADISISRIVTSLSLLSLSKRVPARRRLMADLPTSPVGESGGDPSCDDQSPGSSVRVQDRYLISRIVTSLSLLSLSKRVPARRRLMADLPTSPIGESGSDQSSDDRSPGSSVREQDRYLPITNISRFMKKALPTNGKIAKDAKETVQECVSLFISFVTSEASDKCQRAKRKTINADDLLWAMSALGFEDYIEPLKLYISMYRELGAVLAVALQSSSNLSWRD